MDWPGLISDVNPHDLPLGAARAQDNFQCARLGMLEVRKGLRPVDLGETTGAEADVLAVYGYRPPTRQYAAFQTADGKVFLGNLPESMNPIEEGVSADRPSSFAQDRFGRLFRVNGLQRGSVYDGKNTWKLGITPPSTAPGVTPGGTGSITGAYTCGYRYVDGQGRPSSLSPAASVEADGHASFEWTVAASDETDAGGTVQRIATVELWRSTANQATTLWLVTALGNHGTITASADNGSGKVRFTLPAGHGLLAGAKIAVSGHSVPAYNTEHVVTAAANTTVDTSIAYTAAGTGGSWILGGYTGDTKSDDALEDGDYLPIFTPDGAPAARAFDPPPESFQVIVPLQDRLFYLAPALLSLEEYVEKVENWTTAILGRYVYRDGHRSEEVEDADPAELELSESGTVAVADLVAAGAMVYGHPNARNLLVYSEVDNFEAVPSTVNQVVAQENTDDNDALVGAIPAGSVLYLCKERHTYTATFVRQPRIDLIPTLRFYRGLLNQQCWDFLGDTVYLWDTLGIWSISGEQSMEALSPAVQDFFREGRIDWSKSKWFFTAAEPNEGVVRFHLALLGDAGDYPTRALCYSAALKKWWTESYHVGLCGKCRLEHEGRLRTLVGSHSGKLLLVGEGTADWVAEAVSGTVTSAGADTLVDSGAEFDDELVGAPVAITWGKGRGQRRVVASVEAPTQLTVSPAWTTAPDRTSRYTVGAIPASLRSGLASVPEADDDGERKLVIVHPPTHGDETLLVEGYFDHRAVPEIMQGGGRQGRVLVTDGAATVQVPLRAAQGALGEVPGYKRLPWRLKARPKGDSRRFFSFGFECYQGGERLGLYAVEWEKE